MPPYGANGTSIPIDGTYGLIGRSYQDWLMTRQLGEALANAGGYHAQGVAEAFLTELLFQGAGVTVAIVLVAALAFGLFEGNEAVAGFAAGVGGIAHDGSPERNHGFRLVSNP
jgi:hypothetical protein